MDEALYKALKKERTHGKSYGHACFLCDKKEHVVAGGVEYRLERYMLYGDDPLKGIARRLFFCEPCWQHAAGDEFTMEW